MAAPFNYTITQKQVIPEVIACTSVGLVPYFVSSPGAGKSSLIAKFCKEYRLKLIDVRLTTLIPEDLQGFPMRDGDKASYLPFDTFPIDTDEVPEGYDGWCIFFDEFSSATKQLQAACYKVILDRMVGNHKLHSKVVMVCAGNKRTDNAIVSPMSTALRSRVITYNLEPVWADFNEFAIEEDFDHRITGFLEMHPEKLFNMQPDVTDDTFGCPRTYEFLNRLTKGREINFDIAPRIAGTIGTGLTTEFITYAMEYEKIPKMGSIIAEPQDTPVPTQHDLGARHAIISMIMQSFGEREYTDKELGSILMYVDRFPVELQIVFTRGLVLRAPELRRSNPVFQQYLSKMVQFLREDEAA